MSGSILYIATIPLSFLPIIYTGSKFRDPQFFKKIGDPQIICFWKFNAPKDHPAPSLPKIMDAPLTD